MQQNVFQLTGVDQVIPVHGIEGAKSYPMGANCRAPLFDDSKDVFYIKMTDQNGFPTIKAYSFSEIVMVDPNDSGNGIALSDIRSMIKEELAIVKEELLNVQQPVSESANNTENKPNGDSNTSNSKPNATKYAGGYKGKQPRPNSSIVGNGKEQQ